MSNNSCFFSQWSSSPACTELEVTVMDWAAQLLGLSPEFLNSSAIGGGVIQVNTALTDPDPMCI